MFIAIFVVALLAWGWMTRNQRDWNPEIGLGYGLGIAGLSCVGLLLAYPLRKRIPGLRVFGTVPFWFHTHMLLGVIAPVLILFHCNFQLGSINSNIALWTMLIVASSGVIGRYLYVRVHRDMTGRKAAVRDMLHEAELLRTTLAANFGSLESIVDRMRQIEGELGRRPSGIGSALAQSVATSRRTRKLETTLRNGLRRTLKSNSKSDQARRRALKARSREVIRNYSSYRSTVNDAARLGLYERLFAAWHVLHLPLFILMVIAAGIHVVAVHQY